MPLSPQDVRAKLFTSVRFKHGYDEDEVDAFLDEVERSLAVLHAEVDRLRAQFAASSRPASPLPANEVADTGVLDVVPESQPGAAVVVAATDGEASSAEEMLRRTLLIAQRTADAVIAEARTEAASIVAAAHERAGDAEREASAGHAEKQRERQQEQAQLTGSIERLRSVERDLRDRLRGYLQTQLRELEGDGSAVSPTGAATAAHPLPSAPSGPAALPS